MNENQQLQTTSTSLLSRVAGRFGIEPGRMVQTLKATAFRGEVSNEQMTALLVIADQYQLNPWTREIYAFPDRKGGGIVPVIGVDGWMRIINSHPQMDGVEFDEDGEACTCTIYRKDRAHPIRVTEYLSECRRNTEPWQSHPRRMLRHKALIQCARLAFGFGAIYDPDEAERIIESRQAEIVQSVAELPPEPPKPTPIESVKAKLRKAKAEPAPVRLSPSEWAAQARIEPEPEPLAVHWFDGALIYGQERGLDAAAVTEIASACGLTRESTPDRGQKSRLIDQLEQAARKHAEIDQVKAPSAWQAYETGHALRTAMIAAGDWKTALKRWVLGSSTAGNGTATSQWRDIDADYEIGSRESLGDQSWQEIRDLVCGQVRP